MTSSFETVIFVILIQTVAIVMVFCLFSRGDRVTQTAARLNEQGNFLGDLETTVLVSRGWNPLARLGGFM